MRLPTRHTARRSGPRRNSLSIRSICEAMTDAASTTVDDARLILGNLAARRRAESGF
jgi:hypothetical protein